jgi:hypothetical protein
VALYTADLQSCSNTHYQCGWSTCSTATSVAGWRKCTAAGAPRAISLILSGWRRVLWLGSHRGRQQPDHRAARRERQTLPKPWAWTRQCSWPAIPATPVMVEQHTPRRSGSHGAAGPLHRDCYYGCGLVWPSWRAGRAR